MASFAIEDLIDIPADDLLKDLIMSDSIADLISRADNILRCDDHLSVNQYIAALIEDLPITTATEATQPITTSECENNDDDDVIYVNSEPIISPVEVIDLCSPSPVYLPRKRQIPNNTKTDSDIEYVNTSIVEIYDDNESEPLPNYKTSKRYKILPPAPKEPLPINCPVCLESTLKNKPTSTFCGHIFCYDCIVKSISNSKKCPMCNKKLSLKNIHPIFI